jgi:hypothetical protein
MKRRPRALFTTLSFVSVMALEQTATKLKPYLSIRELSGLTPWTEQAIRTMMAKGILRESEHFFHVGRRPVFKWEAIVSFIEAGTPTMKTRSDTIPHYRDRLSNDEA